MRLLVTAALATLLLWVLPGYLPGDSAWYATQWADGVVVTIWVWVVFKVIDAREFDRKFFMAAVVVVCVVNNFVYPFWVLNPAAQYFGYPVQLGGVLWLLYKVRKRNYEHTGDKIDASQVCICLWRPTKDASFFHSFFGAPVGSVALYTGHTMWGYRWKEKGFTSHYMSQAVVSSKFIVINTGIPRDSTIESKLESLLGTHARRLRTLWLRANCVLTIKSVLAELGDFYKPRPLEFLPSLYAARILKRCKTTDRS